MQGTGTATVVAALGELSETVSRGGGGRGERGDRGGALTSFIDEEEEKTACRRVSLFTASNSLYKLLRAFLAKCHGCSELKASSDKLFLDKMPAWRSGGQRNGSALLQ